LAKVSWEFTTEDARVFLKHLYPVFEEDDEPESMKGLVLC